MLDVEGNERRIALRRPRPRPGADGVQPPGRRRLRRRRGLGGGTVDIDMRRCAAWSARRRSPSSCGRGDRGRAADRVPAHRGRRGKARVELDRKTGHVDGRGATETDEDGNVVREFDDTPADFGRIAATTAKQVILQRLRDAEDELTFGEYAGREGDIVAGVIQQGKDPRNVLVDLGKLEAVLPPPEQVPGRGLRARPAPPLLRRPGREGLRGPQVTLSRTHPNLVQEALRAGGAGDRRRHRRDRRDRPRGRPPHQDRGPLHAARGQRQGRLHRPDGRPGPRRHGRAARREDRHRRLVGRPGRVRRATRCRRRG